MARNSRWKDSGTQAPAAPPAPGPDASPLAAVPPSPTGAPPAPPFAPPVPPAPPGAATAPPAPPVAAAPTGHDVDHEVAELRSTLHQLQATVASLVERTAPAAPIAGATPAADQASRIIVMANNAAEATVAEAQAEAAEIVERARVHSLEIIATARELADQELAAERIRVANATQAWMTRRTEIAARLEHLAASLTGYQSGLSETADAVRVAVAELEAEQTELPIIEELPAPDPSAFIGAELPVPDAGEQVIDLTEPAAPVADELAGSPRTSLFGGPAPVAPVAPSAPGEVVEAQVVEEEPAQTNLRPGLFGR